MVFVCSMGINDMDVKLGEAVHLEVRIVHSASEAVKIPLVLGTKGD